MRKRFWIPLLLALILCLWGFFENTMLKITDFAVSGPELPAAFDGFVIAQISDFHNGRNGGAIVKHLSDLQPDIIVMTGDLIDSQHTDMETALTFVEKAAAIAPCYYVPGNHEAWIREYDTFQTRLQSAGVSVLRNEVLPLERDGQRICLAGIDDPGFLGESIFSKKLAQLKTEDYCILLSHRPEYFDLYCQKEFDLVLSGHAHGGQIRIPFLGGIVAPGQGLFPDYDAGLFVRDRTSMVVSRGLGNSVIPIRLNNPPELVLITLICQ